MLAFGVKINGRANSGAIWCETFTKANYFQEKALFRCVWPGAQELAPISLGFTPWRQVLMASKLVMVPQDRLFQQAGRLMLVHLWYGA